MAVLVPLESALTQTFSGSYRLGRPSRLPNLPDQNKAQQGSPPWRRDPALLEWHHGYCLGGSMGAAALLNSPIESGVFPL